jgi:predicted  nucleic acid-binding Zn-ribbon protein
VDYIPDVSGSLSDEINDLLKQMEFLITKCQSNIENISKAAQSLDHRYAKFVKDIRAFRKKIIECLDRMENEIMNKAQSFLKEAKIKQKT